MFCYSCWLGDHEVLHKLHADPRGLAPVIQKVDNSIHRINLYPLDSVVGFHNTYPLYSDLSGGWRYPNHVTMNSESIW